ncbi:hypothetical protein FBUS_08723 [Fasciolopsis buskii]|uniref:Uncharacterized protein n=1 Tax=Fasciolopsis buskii TaxID=27845 RepID=A0A8E0RT98_9TREM|nr:hypothetical protein FBUS_08723 [Fasciolopsis buski]
MDAVCGVAPNPDPPDFDPFSSPIILRRSGESIPNQTPFESSCTSSVKPRNSIGPVLGTLNSLHEQIANPGGVSVQGLVKDFRTCLAVVDVDNRVW